MARAPDPGRASRLPLLLLLPTDPSEAESRYQAEEFRNLPMPGDDYRVKEGISLRGGDLGLEVPKVVDGKAARRAQELFRAAPPEGGSP